MKAVVFSPFSGASGDMIIGALVDLGADADAVKSAMESCARVSVKIGKAGKCGISATRVSVLEKENGSRSYSEIVSHVETLHLGEEIKKDALAIFRIIAEAEAKVHGSPLGHLHFHELGQEDAIADVVGACAAIHNLGFNKCKILCAPIAAGSGFAEMEHGKFPVPAPATLEILKSSGLFWYEGPIKAEMLTPTGAAILAHFAEPVKSLPQLSVKRIGYGAGRRDFEIPNVLRVMEGDIEEALIADEIEVLETNVDNATGEVLGNLIEKLLAEGAKDACIIPVTMKKSRSGHIIHAIVKPEDSQRLARRIIEETGSLGVRIIPVKHRLIAAREMEKVKIKIWDAEYGIGVKIARDLRGTLLNISAEFEDCKKASELAGIPVKEVMRKAEEEARKKFL